MAWVDPTSRSTQYKILATDWNQDVVANTQFLHDRYDVMWVTFHVTGTPPQVIDANRFWMGANLNTGAAYGSFFVPSDFSALVSATGLFIYSGTGSGTMAVYSQYGVDDDAYNANAESDTGIAFTFSTASDIREIDLSGALTGIAAGDYVALKLVSTTVNPIVIGMKFVYSRA